MFKKSMATALLVLTIPALASASWFLTTQVTSPGGSITSGNKDVPQVVGDGALSKSHVSAVTEPGETISYAGVDAGHSPQKIVLTDTTADGKTTTVLYDVNDVAHQTYPASFPLVAQDGHSYNLTASFLAQSLPIKAGFDVSGAGTASPTAVKYVYYGYQTTAATGPMTFVFSPKSGYTISSILVKSGALPAAATISPDVNNGAVAGENKRVVVTIPVGTTLTSGFDLEAVASVTAKSLNPILPVTLVATKSLGATLTGTANNMPAATFAWTYASGPNNTTAMKYDAAGKLLPGSYQNIPGPAIALFGTDGTTAQPNGTKITLPSTPGTYKFQLTVTDAGKTYYGMATYNVVAEAGDSAQSCQFCHSANLIDTTQAQITAGTTIGDRYAASIHGYGAHGPTCSGCHVGTDTAGHPGNVNGNLVDKVNFTTKINVDGGINGNAKLVAAGSLFCIQCHATPVGSSFTKYGVPHQVTGLGATCAGCHTGTNGTNGADDAHGIQEPSKLTAVPTALCINCHSQSTYGNAAPTVTTNYATSVHAGAAGGGHTTGSYSGCAQCHASGHGLNASATTVNPATFVVAAGNSYTVNEGFGAHTVTGGQIYCTGCHQGTYTVPHSTTALGATCAACHTGTSGLNGTGDAHSIKNPATLATLTYDLCENCHSQATKGNATASVYNDYKASIHGQSDGATGHSTCAACHSGSHDPAKHASKENVNIHNLQTTTATVQTSRGTLAQGAVFCTGCHNPIPHNTANLTVDCVVCHTSDNGQGGTGDAHNIKGLSCQGCHAIAQTSPFDSGVTLVSDNNSGVRAVTDEFKKWSHHIVNAPGVAIVDEQCAVCHLEGTVGMYGFGVDGKKHMTDNLIHLRNAADDTDMQWNPATPNHKTMDDFCMSCHSKDGAKSPMNVKLQALITAATGTTASAMNPFGDTISNRYDKMQRPRVTDVDSQFATTNNSHHGVKGPRYTGRTRNQSAPRHIDSVAFAANSSAALQGIRSTMYDAGNFNALYVPLGTVKDDGNDLGDDSTIHCGDCHTVGQWKAGASTNIDGSATTAVIGAHGSNNEYMLRTSTGVDAKHVAVAYTASAANVVTVNNASSPLLVCYNCHTYNKYGSIFIGTGVDAGNPAGNEMANAQPHAGEYASAGRCNGPGNTLPFNGYTTGTETDGTQFEKRFMGPVTAADAAVGYQNPDFGNVYGIQCLNCHNSGLGNAYGGIHGSANNTSWTPDGGVTTIEPVASVKGGAYIDGAGNTQKVERFLPGLGDMMHVPGTMGGVNGGTVYTKGANAISNDTNWEQKHWQQQAGMKIDYKKFTVTGNLATSAGSGCYTFGESTTVSNNVTAGLRGPSVTGKDGEATEAGTWGGCDDHSAAQGAANHGFVKRIVRPVTY